MKQEMKITVCFGATKIVVPCGTQLPVRELILQAVVRYRKVTNKHADDYIRVHCLQTCDEEAILDEDDTVGDVLDDKDKVIASYEENLVSRPGHNGGDGTSASSVGTASPDIFQGEMHVHSPVKGIPVSSTMYCDGQHKKMTDEYNKPTGSSVKYVESFSPVGSHANMNAVKNDVRPCKNRGLLEGRSSGSDIEGYEGLDSITCSDLEDKDDSEVSAFKRDTPRKSLKSDHLDRWISMQESYYEYKRHEPTGAPPSPDDRSVSELEPMFGRQVSLSLSEIEDIKHLNIVLKPTMGEDLGITVQGYKTADGRELGLIVFEIDPKGCAARDGRVQVADRIVAVNSQDLTNISNERANEAFNKAVQCGSIELGISRSHSFISESQSCPKSIRTISVTSSKDDDEADNVTEEERNTVSPLPSFKNSIPGDFLPLKNDPNDVVPRIVEKTISIELLKGSDGLGFSVTSRDNPAGGNCPIYVKNILPYGAAIRDGRLQAGDQILEVGGIDMTGKTQQQAVTLLRSAKGQVKLRVKRKVTVTSPIGPTKLIKDLERAPSDSRGNKILTYRVRLPSSGTAGLGITVKGKSNAAELNQSGDDLGIFIKSIVPGGAAQQDGRLRPDDQLISVNGVKLAGMSNSSAMKTLRSAMEDSSFLGTVEVSVIRSVKEIMNTVRELESIEQRKNTSDRAIDVDKNEDQPSVEEKKDITDGTTSQTNENESNSEKNEDDDTRKLKSIGKPVLDDETTELSTNYKPTVDENITGPISRRKLSSDDELTELKPHRKPVKLGNGVHRNPSYYIAMNRSGQRERHSKSNRPLRKSPFYQPHSKSSTASEQSIEIARPLKEEKPKIVIASYTDAARVSTPTRAFCISSRPTSTVAEPTPPMSTTATASRSSEANVEKSHDKTTPTHKPNGAKSKRPSGALPIAKGTPPPPPPRTSRPSPYAKQFPNYLPANALAVRKSDSTFSDYSDNSETSSAFQNLGENSTEVVSVTQVNTKVNDTDKSNALVAENKTQSKPEDHDTHRDDVTDCEATTQEPFKREGFGRQSMSEKRFKLAQADITQTEFYKQRVTRSKSLEGANQVNDVSPFLSNAQSKTLPRPSSSSSDKGKRPNKEHHNERLIGSDSPKKEYGKGFSHLKTISTEATIGQGYRGQWRTSSDGIVKKYGRHGNYIKASPLASSKNNNQDDINAVHSDGSLGGGEEAIPITMQSNADYSSVHPKVKKKQSPFNLKVLGAALKPKAYKGKYDMQCRPAPDSPSEPRIEFPDEQRYRQLVLGEKQRGRSASETVYGSNFEGLDLAGNRTGTRRRKVEQGKKSPGSLQDFLRKGSGEYSITESAQI